MKLNFLFYKLFQIKKILIKIHGLNLDKKKIIEGLL